MMQTWQEAIGAEKEAPYFQHILATVKAERQSGQMIYPPAADVFNAFKATEFSQVKVVILGQDPYHGEGQAHGLSFSVRHGVAVPPSLQNIYKELAADIEGFQIPQHGCLQAWAEQGVLLLNTVLTVRAHQAHSHAGLGWEVFTDKVIRQVAEQRQNVVFLLWGGHAQRKGQFIDRDRHLVITSSHPSPLSAYRGFLGSRPFSRANAYLVEHGYTPINWQV